MAKKKKKTQSLSKTLFKTTGKDTKMKIDDKKKKLYYFKPKVDEEKAKKLGSVDGAEIMGVSEDSLKVSKPSLKYDFYCIYDATVYMKFVRVRDQEIGVQEQLLGAMVGKEVFMPKKGKEIPGKAIFLEITELFEIENKAEFIIDGSTGFPARTLEKLLKGPGKKRATPAWLRKGKITSGKLNSVEKVVKALAKDAGKAPKEAKRVVEHSLTFNTLDGFYVPTYYVNIRAGEQKKTMRINAIDGNVALKV